MPRNVDALVFHPYLYRVLGEIIAEHGLRERPFDPDALAASGLLRPDVPPFMDDRVTGWRAVASIVCPGEMYAHDFVDPVAWDAWLYERYPEHRLAMAQKLELWMAAAADLAADRGVPLLFGEGWVGYTPLHGRFEEDAAGLALIHQAMVRSAELGALGTIVCSNAAPHHPMWTRDKAAILDANRLFLER